MPRSGFDFTTFLRQGLPAASSLSAGLPKYNFIGGHNDPEQIPVDALIEAAAASLRAYGSRLAIYNLGQGPLGHTRLREFLARKLGATRGIEVSPDNILITSGSLQAIDLVNEILLDAGDTVIIEEFTYGGTLTRLKRLGVKIVGAPLDSGGLKMDALAGILADLQAKGIRPKYIYTIPTVQNPTGSILSLDRRRELLRLAAEYGVPIFEDECYADIIWKGGAPPALYGLDRRQVIHIGSFSKSLAPALRIGYVVADEMILGRMLGCKTDGGTGALDQMVAAEYFGKEFERHIATLTKALDRKKAAMVEAMEREFGASVDLWLPEGGIFLWAKLPDEVDVRTLIAPAAKAGIAFNPGPEWACNPEAAKSYMRLCFALATPEEIREGIAQLAQICFEQTGIPVRGANRPRAG